MFADNGVRDTDRSLVCRACRVGRFWLFENEGITGPFPSAIGKLANLSEFSWIFKEAFMNMSLDRSTVTYIMHFFIIIFAIHFYVTHRIIGPV